VNAVNAPLEESTADWPDRLIDLEPEEKLAFALRDSTRYAAQVHAERRAQARARVAESLATAAAARQAARRVARRRRWARLRRALGAVVRMRRRRPQ
jgi:hypothetical protein